MKQYFCNPVNINYRYQFHKNIHKGGMLEVAREAADPSMILFQDKYYIFASMTLGVWVSEDIVNWENHRLPENLPLYDYAPDVRVIGEYVYFCASKQGEICNYYRTKDVLNGPYEEIPGTFDFWDPHLFMDDDGKVYFYWGCSSMTPVWGVEVDPVSLKPIGEKKELIFGDCYTKGFERVGEDNTIYPIADEELEVRFHDFLEKSGTKESDLASEMVYMIKGFLRNAPYIEGAWMNKYQGRYYLQYAANGTEYNVYTDGVYVSDSPLGPYTLAKNNPYSYKPGGFLPGAGHGSTTEDRYGNLWHSATMRISMNHQFERRVGIWPAGFDSEGELFCNQRYGDWPLSIEQGKMDPWKDPEWYLLSYQKAMTASSHEEGKEPEKAADENVQTWWRAASEKPGEWLQMDLGKVYDVRAMQINFADDKMDIPVPGEIRGTSQARYIDEANHVTRWRLEGSVNGKEYFVVEDKSQVRTNLPHDLAVKEEGMKIRFLKLTVLEIPYDQKPCISGLRVFGIDDGDKPAIPEFTAVRVSDIDMDVTIKDNGADGYNILWGHNPEKLYHNYMIFDTEKRVGALVKGHEYYVRVDAFNEAGITEGKIIRLES
ncbi:family 43 glycosylhydrolase [Anaerobium acetethylicum]|uniref:F5/8 type C domain-containing protein n=1 Tax=Anaerobium acetethylicum TaxID=1619234 RepID=A0A1D3TX54_9FIRM|nr:family 43 glycosylhydrolase [Anaerobium acetethylicum]SCP98847.1 F5/8 type C domain-containing protein [Anaerobium acetethylicum]